MDGGHTDGEVGLITRSSPGRAGLDSALLKELINENVNSRRLKLILPWAELSVLITTGLPVSPAYKCDEILIVIK